MINWKLVFSPKLWTREIIQGQWAQFHSPLYLCKTEIAHSVCTKSLPFDFFWPVPGLFWGLQMQHWLSMDPGPPTTHVYIALPLGPAKLDISTPQSRKHLIWGSKVLSMQGLMMYMVRDDVILGDVQCRSRTWTWWCLWAPSKSGYSVISCMSYCADLNLPGWRCWTCERSQKC